jgi:hypothetical protein
MEQQTYWRMCADDDCRLGKVKVGRMSKLVSPLVCFVTKRQPY